MSEQTDALSPSITNLVFQKLESISLQLNAVATKEELKELKSTVGSMVPRTEMDARWKSSEGSMDEIRKSLESMREEIRRDKADRSRDFDKFQEDMRIEIKSVKTKIDTIEDNKLPTWLVGTLSTIFGSLAVLAVVWAMTQAFHVTSNIHP